MWHNDPKVFEWRFNYFAAMVLPRLQKQTVQDFDIRILAAPKYHKLLIHLDKTLIKPFVLHGDTFDYKTQGNFKNDDIKGFYEHKNFWYYRRQTRLDSDDLVTPDFVATIVKQKTPYVSFQPMLFVTNTLQCKSMRHRYNSKKPSMFLSVLDYPECIYHRVFTRFNDQPCTVLPEGYAFMSIHDHNQGTTAQS